MAIWNQLMMCSEDIKLKAMSQYDDINFPVELRSHLADMIESNIYKAVTSESDPQYSHIAFEFLQSLILELNNLIVRLEDFELRQRMDNIAFNYLLFEPNNAVQLYSFLRRCLYKEQQLLQASKLVNQISDEQQVTNEIQQLLQFVQTNNNLNQQIYTDCDNFHLEFHEVTRLNYEYEQIVPSNDLAESLRRRNAQIDISFSQVLHNILQLETDYNNLLNGTKTVLSKVIKNYIYDWKNKQCLIGYKEESIEALNKIQEWFENLSDIIWNTREQIKLTITTRAKLNPIHQNLQDYLPQCFKMATELLTLLITNSFIIEQQPPQVLKKQTKFPVNVRLLTGSKLNILSQKPSVSVSIVSELQAQATQIQNKASEETSGKLTNNKCTMDNKRNVLSADFKNLQLKTIKRTERNGMVTVMDEKFSLLFQTTFNVGLGDLIYEIWTLSLPVVVIVHGNQEAQSWATITWDNAFSDPTRIPFQVSDKVKWSSLGKAINSKFVKETEKPLSQDNLNYLCEKLFGRSIKNPDQMEISWAQFCKESLPKQKFTFWEWFYSIMKLTSNLRKYWKYDLIHGFVHKKDAEELLMKSSPGTFLLRFSDSLLGGIGISVAMTVNSGLSKYVMMLKPFTSKDFSARSLADRISDFHKLTTLYPNNPKDKAFGKYYTQASAETKTDGYIDWLLLVTAPGLNEETSPQVTYDADTIMPFDYHDSSSGFDYQHSSPAVSTDSEICGYQTDDTYFPQLSPSQFSDSPQYYPSVCME